MVILTVSTSGSLSEIAKFIAEKNCNFPTLVDVQGNARHDYQIQYTPTAYLIDRDGLIRDKSFGGWQDLEQIERKLAKIMP